MQFQKFHLNKKPTHTTHDEIVFIQTIGLHCEQSKSMNRIEILNKYVKALELRQNWDMIDRFKVINFANDHLQRELNYVV